MRSYELMERYDLVCAIRKHGAEPKNGGRAYIRVLRSQLRALDIKHGYRR